MKEKFNFDKFYNKMGSIKVKLETKHISNYLKCSIRSVQKWCKKNNIEYYRIKGIKHYIIDMDVIFDFGQWYNKRINKPQKPKKQKRERKKKIVKKRKTITFVTIKDIVEKININNRYKNSRLSLDTKIRYIQRWCLRSNVPFEYCYGRKYYKITDEIISKINKVFE